MISRDYIIFLPSSAVSLKCLVTWNKTVYLAQINSRLDAREYGSDWRIFPVSITTTHLFTLGQTIKIHMLLWQLGPGYNLALLLGLEAPGEFWAQASRLLVTLPVPLAALPGTHAQPKTSFPSAGLICRMSSFLFKLFSFPNKFHEIKFMIPQKDLSWWEDRHEKMTSSWYMVSLLSANCWSSNLQTD